MRAPRRAANAIAVGVVCAVLGGCTGEEPASPPLSEFLDLPGAAGRLRVAHYGAAGVAEGPVLAHRHTWRPLGDGAIEDVDLRGNLDGTFKWGWNQPSQTHVRLGRRGRGAKFAEYELFRVALRWGGLELPPGATIDEAALTYHVENPPETVRRVELYGVVRAFGPGQGGVRGDNTSPPKRGEMWWGAARHEVEPWGLPGAGYASDRDPAADTQEMALATAVLAPGEDTLRFASPQLAAWIERAQERGEPPYFLIKLSDALEDTPGTAFEVYSTDSGEPTAPVRRPALELVWSAPAQPEERHVRLEHGRTHRPGRRDCAAGWLVASFEAEAGSGPLTVEVRGAHGDAAPSAWQVLRTPLAVDWTWYELRLTASAQPLALGQPFETTLRDTWTRTAAPEDQRVPWTFTSPSGLDHEVLAEYVGAWTWRVVFEPEELGRWTYRWSHDFTKDHHESAEGVFDVVARDRVSVLAHIARLRDRAAARDREDGHATKRAMASLMRAERAALALETAESFAGPSGEEFRAALNELRAVIDEPRPEVLELFPESGVAGHRQPQASR